MILVLWFVMWTLSGGVGDNASINATIFVLGLLEFVGDCFSQPPFLDLD